MKSKTLFSKNIKYFAPSKEMYKATSHCFDNDIKAYIVRFGKEFMVELDYKGIVKTGKVLYKKQKEAEKAIWLLYLDIYNRLKNNS
tara:strand:+ start:336 stop:593 length:258 start_codon:yes stop_codon:yes gene_type:complete